MGKLRKKRTACLGCPAHNEYSCAFGFDRKRKSEAFGMSMDYPDEPCFAPKTIKEYIELANAGERKRA